MACVLLELWLLGPLSYIRIILYDCDNTGVLLDIFYSRMLYMHFWYQLIKTGGQTHRDVASVMQSLFLHLIGMALIGSSSKHCE